MQDLRKPGAKPQPLFTAWDALYNFIGSKGDELYFQTTNDAPRGRVIAVDARDPAPGAVAHRRSAGDIAIDNATYVGGRVVVEYTRDARSVVRLFDDERHAGGRSAVAGPRHRRRHSRARGTNPETFFSYSDYLSPTRIMRLDVAANTVSEFRTPKVPADFSPYVTEQVFYPSKDGTRVPMFITRRKDAPRDGNGP